MMSSHLSPVRRNTLYRLHNSIRNPTVRTQLTSNRLITNLKNRLRRHHLSTIIRTMSNTHPRRIQIHNHNTHQRPRRTQVTKRSRLSQRQLYARVTRSRRIAPHSHLPSANNRSQVRLHQRQQHPTNSQANTQKVLNHTTVSNTPSPAINNLRALSTSPSPMRRKNKNNNRQQQTNRNGLLRRILRAQYQTRRSHLIQSTTRIPNRTRITLRPLRHNTANLLRPQRPLQNRRHQATNDRRLRRTRGRRNPRHRNRRRFSRQRTAGPT